MTGRGRTRRAGGRLAALLVLAALLALLAASALAEQTQHGQLISSFDGGISPRTLPRDKPAPVTVHLSGALRTADGSPLPRVHTIELSMLGRGRLDTRGLPTCPRDRLTAAEPVTALAICGRALVGSGRISARVFLAGQPPFTYRATLRAFNTRLPGGRPGVLLHVYSPDPPSSFVLAFRMRREPGATSLIATIPAGVGPTPHLARFHMRFGRIFHWRGARHSYLSAACPLPPRFTAGFFPLARATYTLAGGRVISTEIVRGCRARPTRPRR